MQCDGWSGGGLHRADLGRRVLRPYRTEHATERKGGDEKKGGKGDAPFPPGGGLFFRPSGNRVRRLHTVETEPSAPRRCCRGANIPWVAGASLGRAACCRSDASRRVTARSGCEARVRCASGC